MTHNNPAPRPQSQSNEMTKYRNHESIANNETFQDFTFEHQSAMTGEDLHSKIDIAKELAYRDYKIESLKLQLKVALAPQHPITP